MAESLGDYWWVLVVGSFLGAFLAPIIGYYRRPRNGNQTQSTFHGTAMFDASVARDLLAQMVEQVIQIRRVAEAAEGLLEVERGRERLDQRRREAEHEDAIRERDALRRKLDQQERDKR